MIQHQPTLALQSLLSAHARKKKFNDIIKTHETLSAQEKNRKQRPVITNPAGYTQYPKWQRSDYRTE